MQFFTGFSQYNFNKTRYMHVVYSCSDGGGGDDDLEDADSDLLQCQKRPTPVSKETYYSVKRDLEDADLVERQVDFDRLLSGDPYRHTDRRTDQATQTHRHTDKDTQTKNWQEWAAVGAHNDRELYDGQVYTFFLIFFLPTTTASSMMDRCTHFFNVFFCPQRPPVL
jgi:hypothetical protein